jgi:hypothetical protein
MGTRTVHPEEQIQMELYPNPVRDQLFIQLPDEWPSGFRIDVLDPLGRMVIHQDKQHHFTTTEVDVSHLATGMYFVRITAPGNYAAQKRVFISN